MQYFGKGRNPIIMPISAHILSHRREKSVYLPAVLDIILQFRHSIYFCHNYPFITEDNWLGWASPVFYFERGPQHDLRTKLQSHYSKT
jgi:hypothetical protein